MSGGLIAVCVRPTARGDASGGGLSPFDRTALEFALRTGRPVAAVAMAPRSDENTLARLTRLGVRAVLVSDAAFAGSDTLATARILCRAVKFIGADAVFVGEKSLEGETAQVGPMLARLLGWDFSLESGSEKGYNNRVTAFPRGDELRFPKMGSRASAVELVTNAELRVPAGEYGAAGSPTRVLGVTESVMGRRTCETVNLSELSRIIALPPRSATKPIFTGTRIPVIHCVGAGCEELARGAAERIEPVGRLPFDEMLAYIKTRRPEVMLWDGDEYGRITAPEIAAALGVGLCADCVSIGTDGGRVAFERPALAGTVMARVACDSSPAMATVRTTRAESDVILSLGLGAEREFDRLAEYARSRGWKLGASRALADKLRLPRGTQIGLTGVRAACRVYIAIGISGAVQHVCGISGAGTVVAVNRDRRADIFDYADYGIISDASELFRG